MTTLTSASYSDVVRSGDAGNVCSKQFQFDGAITSGDVIKMGYVPLGTRLLRADVFSDATNASMTAKVGYAASDGTTSTTNGVADKDDDYFVTSTALATATRVGYNGVLPPIVTQKKTDIIVTTGGANAAAGTTITVVLTYENVGNP